MNRMRQRKVRNDRALHVILNLNDFQEDDTIKIADEHTKPAAKRVRLFYFFIFFRDDDDEIYITETSL